MFWLLDTVFFLFSNEQKRKQREKEEEEEEKGNKNQSIKGAHIIYSIDQGNEDFSQVYT